MEIKYQQDYARCVKLPCDCFISAFRNSDTTAANAQISINGQSVDSRVFEPGFYCSRGAEVTSFHANTTICPILRGDGSEDSFFEYREKQTPQQITQFINDNMGENGRGYFQQISNLPSGIYGRTPSSTTD